MIEQNDEWLVGQRYLSEEAASHLLGEYKSAWQRLVASDGLRQQHPQHRLVAAARLLGLEGELTGAQLEQLSGFACTLLAGGGGCSFGPA